MAITPSEVPARKASTIPDAVIEIFDRHIAHQWDGREAVLGQDELCDDIARHFGFNRSEVFARKLLDVEEVYRAAGWNVEYDKPAYCETYPATFTFTPKT